MKRTLSFLFAVIMILSTQCLFISCTPEDETITVVVDTVEWYEKTEKYLISGHSIYDGRQYSFIHKTDLESGIVVEVMYLRKNVSDGIISPDSVHVISNEAVYGKMVFLEEFGACMITELDGEKKLFILFGGENRYYKDLRTGEMCAMYFNETINTVPPQFKVIFVEKKSDGELGPFLPYLYQA